VSCILVVCDMLKAIHPISLGRLSGVPEASNTTLRMLDFFSIPKAHGDCVVLLLSHPGPNLFGRYFSASKVNALLPPDVSRGRPQAAPEDVYMVGADEYYESEVRDPYEWIDLATFLE
jgi:hypothetical protein